MKELKPEDVMKALKCFHQRILDTKIAEQITEQEMMAVLHAIVLLRETRSQISVLKKLIDRCETKFAEKDAEIERLKEMIDTSSEVVDYAVDKIREARASMLDEARRLSFEAGDQQYISIAELEKIAEGNVE